MMRLSEMLSHARFVPSDVNLRTRNQVNNTEWELVTNP